MSATWGSSFEGGCEYPCESSQFGAGCPVGTEHMRLNVGGPFEMLDLCEAAGIEPVITTTAQSAASHATPGSPSLPACCAPEDMADLIEYC
eukprot:SAG31_NODE_21572_length_546_cov_0.805369_1_plen_90_part_01